MWFSTSLGARTAAATVPPRTHRRLRLEALEDRTTPSTAGALDLSFGTGGHVLTSFANNYDSAEAVTVQPDGRIVIAGQTGASGSRTGNDFLVARYNASGSLDTSFGSSGKTSTDFKGANDRAADIALVTGGKILAAGHVAGGGNRGYDFGLARYNANGTLDTAFGSRGKVFIDLGGDDFGTAMAVDASGRILVGGYTDAPGYFVAALVRYNANGTLDTTFGNGGKLVTSITNSNSLMGVGVALQPDGKIVIAGNNFGASFTFMLARFNANGTPDTGFGSGGSVNTLVGAHDNFGGLTLQPDGKIVLAGWDTGLTSYGGYVLRYNPDGTLDAGFGSGGVVSLVNPYGWYATSGPNVVDVSLQTDGKIVLGGQLYDAVGQQHHFIAVRLGTTGAVDTGYGDQGWASAQFGYADRAGAMAIQPDGRVLLVGSARPSSGSSPTDVALVRFLASAPQVGSFTASPTPVPAGNPVTLTAAGINDGNAGATVTQVAFYADTNGDGVLGAGDALLGYGTPNADGSWTLALSTAGWAAGSYTLFALATDSYGAVGDPTAFTLQLV